MATTGNVYLDLTGSRRDQLTGPLTVYVTTLSAGGNADVQLEQSVVEQGTSGFTADPVQVINKQGPSGLYNAYYQPDGGSAGQVLDPALFTTTTSSTPIANTLYDFRNRDASGNLTGNAGLAAGGNIVVKVVHSLVADPRTDIIGITDQFGSGHIDTTTNGNVTYTDGPDANSPTGYTMRVGTITSTNGNVLLTVPDYPSGGQNLDVISGLQNTPTGIFASGTILLQVSDNVTTELDSLLQSSQSVTIVGDYENTASGVGSTITINGGITSPTTLIQGGSENDTVILAPQVDSMPANEGDLNKIQSTVTITEGAGNDNHLILNDMASTSSKTVVMTNSTITGFAGGVINYSATGHFLDAQNSNDGILLQSSLTQATTFVVPSTLFGSTTELQGGGADDTFNIGNVSNTLSNIQGALTVDGGGNDNTLSPTLSFSSNDNTVTRSSNSLASGDMLNIYDQGNTNTNLVYGLSATTISQSTLPVSITYVNVETLLLQTTATQAATVNVTSTAASVNTNISAGSAADTINIGNTGQNSNVVVNAGDGNNAVYLQATGLNSFTSIKSGAGTDTVYVASNAAAGAVLGQGSMNNVNGTVGIDVGGGSGNRLILDNTQGNANTNTIINSDNIRNLAPATLFYFASNGGSYNDTTSNRRDGIRILGSNQGTANLYVQSTLGSSTTEIDGGAVNNNFFVTSDAGTGSLNQGDLYRGNNYGVQGTLTIQGGSGTGNQLVVSDYADTTVGHDSNIQVTNNLIHNFAAADIYYSAVNGGQFNNANNSGILLKGSHTLANTFLVTSTFGVPNPSGTNPAPATTTYEIDGGLGNDAFNVGSTHASNNGNFDLIQGLVTVVGNGGSDTLVANDHGATGAFNYIVTPTSIVNDPSTVATVPTPTTPPPRTFAGITYNASSTAAVNTVTSLTLDATDQVNIITVTPSQIATYTINGNGPASGQPIVGGGDYLQLNTNVFADRVGGRQLHITSSPGNGFWTFSDPNHTKTVYFTSIERFNHVSATAAVESPGTVTVRDAETGKVEYMVRVPTNIYDLAVSDVNYDGIPDLLVAAPGANNATTITIYNGTPDANANYNHAQLNSFTPFAASFHGSVSLGTGDVNRDGANDLVVGQGPTTGSPTLVEVFNGKTLQQATPTLLGGFYPFGTTFSGGVNVAVGDLNNDGYADIVTTELKGNAAVKIFSYLPALPTPLPSYAVPLPPAPFALVRTFTPTFTTSLNGGMSVAVGDYNGDGWNDIIFGSGAGARPEVMVYGGGPTLFTSTATPPLLALFSPTPSTATGGVIVKATAVNGGNPGTIERVFLGATLLGTSPGTPSFFWYSYLVNDLLPRHS